MSSPNASQCLGCSLTSQHHPPPLATSISRTSNLKDCLSLSYVLINYFSESLTRLTDSSKWGTQTSFLPKHSPGANPPKHQAVSAPSQLRQTNPSSQTSIASLLSTSQQSSVPASQSVEPSPLNSEKPASTLDFSM